MPRLSYPSAGRVASARSKEDLEVDKSNSIKIVDQIGDVHPEIEEKNIKPEVLAEGDDTSAALQKQIDALRKSEQAQKERAEQAIRGREEAIKRARERETENTQLKRQTVDSQVEYVSASLAAATAEAEKAQSDIEKALELGDFKGQAEAYRRLSRAETSIARLEDGRVELEAKVKASEQKTEVRQPDPIEDSPLPEIAKDFLRQNRDYMDVPEKNAKLNWLHHRAIKAGLTTYTQDYFTFIKDGMEESEVQNKPQEEYNGDNEPPEPRRRSSMVSAPVSREAPSSSNGERPGQVRLSTAQLEAAKIAGITPKEYAEQVLELRKQKANGLYGGGQ